MITLILETFRPYVLAALIVLQIALMVFGTLLLLLALAIHSLLGAAESLVFLAPAVLLTPICRFIGRIGL